MHSRNYEISSLLRHAETRRARNSDGKSLLFQRNSLCPRERHKKSWVAALTNYCQSHSSHSTASFLSNCEMGTYIRRASAHITHTYSIYIHIYTHTYMHTYIYIDIFFRKCHCAEILARADLLFNNYILTSIYFTIKVS